MQRLTRWIVPVLVISSMALLAWRVQPHAQNRSSNSGRKSSFVTNIYGETLSWKGQIPIEFRIHKSVPSAMIPVIQRAMDTWEAALGKKVFVIVETQVDGSVAEMDLRDGKNTIYNFSAGEWHGTTDDQAKTLISWVGNQIQEADILINSQNHDFFLGHGYFKPAQIDLQSTMVHELGHVLGLNHIDGRPSTMSTWLARGETRRSLFKEDVAAVMNEY